MKNVVSTNKAPAAIGPYSQAIALGGFVFTSGQLPLDPQSMIIVSGGIKEQTRQSLLNLKEILEQAGASLNTVLKTTCFLADINDFAEFNSVYSEIFGDTVPPARSCVEAARLPKDALIEIEATAFILGK